MTPCSPQSLRSGSSDGSDSIETIENFDWNNTGFDGDAISQAKSDEDETNPLRIRTKHIELAQSLSLF